MLGMNISSTGSCFRGHLSEFFFFYCLNATTCALANEYPSSNGISKKNGTGARGLFRLRCLVVFFFFFFFLDFFFAQKLPFDLLVLNTF